MKKAITLKPFRDLTEGVDREIGSTFSVDDERAEYLERIGLIKAEQVVSEEPKTKKRTAKKKEV